MKKFIGYEKGVNFGGWLSQCTEYTDEHYKKFIVESDFEKVAAWGADHVRVPVDWQVFQREDGTFIESGFSYVDNAILWAKKNKLNLILDLHKTLGYSFDAGEEKNNFFANEKLHAHFYALWEEFSKRYVKYEDMIAFELLNEVTSPSYSDAWNKISAKAIETIRRHSKTIKILIGGYWNNSIDSLKDLLPPADENIVYNFHCYDPLMFTHQGAPWVSGMPHGFRLEYPTTYKKHNDAALSCGFPDFVSHVEDDSKTYGPEFFVQKWQAGIKVCQERGAALYCGEYGVIDRASPEQTLAWYKDINAAIKECGIGRAAWSYKLMDYGLSDDRMKDVAGELVKCL